MLSRKLLGGLALTTVLFASLTTRITLGQGQPQASPQEFQKAVVPVLAKSCFGCHNDQARMGGLSLQAYTDPAAALAHPEVWQKVLDKLAAGEMPPRNVAPLAAADADAVMGWLKRVPGVTDRTPVPTAATAGRVTARRLNRVEYNNTIRDLLGVAARPADQFPVDDSGYGFDNNGDVLSVSPLLMEKYMQAAKDISRLAVYGESVPEKPTRLVRLLNRRSPDAHDVLSSGNAGVYLPYSLRGAMYGTFTFPVDGEYEFRLRIANFRGDNDADLPDEEKARREEERRKQAEQRRLERLKAAAAGVPQAPRVPREPTPEELKAREEAARQAAPPRKLILTVDGGNVISTVIEGNSSFGYSQGEFTARVAVKAGERFIRASYPELANLENPLLNINPDMRRALFVDYLDIVGPFNPSKARPASYQKVFTCTEATPRCARTILTGLLERAYRRPVTEAEIASKLELVTLAQREGDPFEEGIRLALQAILASPNFLFRVESDTPAPPAPAARRSGNDTTQPVSDIELASRLSYFLWASMPDQELMKLAKAGVLSQPPILEAQVRRMLVDAKAYNLVDNWAAQWLQLRNLGRTKPDPLRFPTVDDELLDAMRAETDRFIEASIKEDRRIREIIDARMT
jgi:hypothetical protein